MDLGALKCERETDDTNQLHHYSTIHFCLRLALNQHLQLVTCLGQIWVPWVSSSGLDGPVSHPNCCSLVPLSPCPLGKYSSVWLFWNVKGKQKLLLNYTTTVPCILFKLSVNVTFTSCYLFGRNMCCLSIHKGFGWHRLQSWPHYFSPFLPLKPEEVIVSLGALKRERETNFTTQLQDYSTMHFCLSLVLT